jgi:hypothetical protein
MKNLLAYYAFELITAVKSLIVQAPGQLYENFNFFLGNKVFSGFKLNNGLQWLPNH